MVMTPKKISLIMQKNNLQCLAPRMLKKLEIKMEINKKLNEIKELNKELVEMDSYKSDNKEILGFPILEQLNDKLLINKV